MKLRYSGIVVLVILALMAASCEDSDISAPEGSVITLTASGPIFIDQTKGQTQGSTTVIAQLVDSTGLPVDDIPLFFTTTSGLMASTSNVCGSGGACTDGNPCLSNADCPDLPDVVETNENGIATDVLTMRLLEDQSTATVVVKGTSLEASVAITKTVYLGTDPVAHIVATPAVGQRTGLPFSFDGSSSTTDPNLDVECFEWEIASSLDVFDPFAAGCAPCAVPGTALCSDSCTDRGKAKNILSLKIGSVGDSTLDQDLLVVLRVSDDPTIVCTNSAPADPGKFGPFPATLSYTIRCDTTPPTVNAGGNQSGSLSASGGVVSLGFSASASDPEDTQLDFLWDCGNGTGGTQQSVTCSYTNQGVFTATVTVTNDCGIQAQDSLVVTINT